MKKGMGVIGVQLFILMLTSCCCLDAQSLLFSGQSQHWQGDYRANAGGHDEEGRFTFKYKNAVNQLSNI